jgi:WD40 repeat protein
VKIWDVASGQRNYTLSDSLDAVNTIAFHPSGKLLAGAGADRTIRVWELGENEGRQIKSLIAHEDAINQIAFSPDGKTLASASADRRVKIWDASELVEIHTTEIQSDWVFALAFSPDGKRLAVGRYDGSMAVYDPVTGKSLAGR